ncbi:MAG: ISKra4 family transposase, partial [Acidobacteria bacterium Pan2503]|nr:ISKra4 family transposase [Candidatus Acidoferrum panamensis]
GDQRKDLPGASNRGYFNARGKKTAAAIRQEITHEVEQLLRLVFSGCRKTGRVDLEALETAVRSAMHRAGAAALSELLHFPVPAADQRSIPCGCGHQAVYQELRTKPVLTAVGEATVSRPYYLCPHCHQGQFPADVELDIQHTEFSPGVRRMQAVVGQEAPFDQGRQQMKLLADLEVTTKAVERTAEAIGEDVARGDQQEVQRALQLDLPMVMGAPVPILYVQMDGTGVPVVKKETEGRKGKVDGQPAHTREAKLGCVFTQTAWDEEGFAIRDPDSTTYVGAIETAEEFGKRLYVEAWKRGWSRAEKKVVIGDGAEWIWNLANEHFPSAVQIVDLYHARQHLWELARQLYPQDPANQRAWIKIHQKRLLDKGKIEKLVAALRALHSANPELAEKIRIEADYFETNTERMRYPKFRRQHLFVGSGVIEAGCKTVIGSRLKRSGMFWTVRGANAILALRCCHLNGRFEDYWEARRAA